MVLSYESSRRLLTQGNPSGTQPAGGLVQDDSAFRFSRNITMIAEFADPNPQLPPPTPPLLIRYRPAINVDRLASDALADVLGEVDRERCDLLGRDQALLRAGLL